MAETQSPEQTPNSRLDEKKQKSKYGHMDLADFVFEVEKFSKLIEPISFVIYCCEDARRWRYPVFSLVSWLVCNFACLILTKGAVFALVSLLVISIATSCLVQLHTGLLGKFLPTVQSVNPGDDGSDSDDEAALKTVKQFRFSLLQVYDFIVQCNGHLAHFYSIIRWDNTLISLRFHVELCVFLLSLVVLPTRAIVFLFINWYFIGNEDVFYNVLKICDAILGKGVNNSNDQVRGSQKDPSLNEEKEQDSRRNGTIEKSKELDADPENVRLTSDEEEKLTTSNKPGMVARLMEIKKRKQIIANESCFKCEVSFASILKRRFYCRHCGNNFCSKCCNQKVPKSMFGATSPEAQTETVLVCTVCYELLKGQTNREKIS